MTSKKDNRTTSYPDLPYLQGCSGRYLEAEATWARQQLKAFSNEIKMTLKSPVYSFDRKSAILNGPGGLRTRAARLQEYLDNVVKAIDSCLPDFDETKAELEANGIF
jgi:hypothetical protein